MDAPRGRQARSRGSLSPRGRNILRVLFLKYCYSIRISGDYAYRKSVETLKFPESCYFFTVNNRYKLAYTKINQGELKKYG